MSFWVIRAIFLRISFIMTFKCPTFDSADVLDSISFVRVALNYRVINDVACFNSNALVWPFEVEALRDASPGGYTSPPVKEALSPRIQISSPVGYRSMDDVPSSEASSYSASYWLSTDVMEGYLVGTILKSGGEYFFVHDCSFLPIWCDLIVIVTVSLTLTCAHA